MPSWISTECSSQKLFLQEANTRQLAVSTLQACVASALEAGELQTAITAAELVVACLGNTDAQHAAEALLLAQSCWAVMPMEATYTLAAAPQVTFQS